MSHAPRTGLVAPVLSLLVVVGVAPARADDLPIVKLDAHGPSAGVPIGTSFYLAGDAKEAAVVQAFVVRVGSPSLFGDRIFAREASPPCRAVFAELEQAGFRLAADGTPPTYAPGTLSARAIWQTRRDSEVRVSSAWKPEGGATQFKVLVQHDPAFFTRGYRYCISIYRSMVERTADPILAQQLQDAANPAACLAAEDKPARDRCDAERLQVFTGALDALPPHQREVATVAALKVFGDARNALASLPVVEQMLGAWSEAVVPAPPAVPYELAIDVPRPSKSVLRASALGRITLALLVHHGKVVPVYDPDHLGVIRVVTKDGKLEIRGVRILPDGSIGAFSDPSAADVTSLAVKTSDLGIPGTELTLADVLALARGELPFEGKWITPAAFVARLAPALIATKAGQPLPADTAALMERVRGRLVVVADGVRALTSAYVPPGTDGPPPPPLGTPDSIRHLLGAWLEAGLLVPCAPERLARWGLDGPCDDTSTEWPRYAPGRAPLDALAGAIGAWSRDYPAWLATWSTVVTQATTLVAVGDPVEVQLQYTMDTWFFDYVSPVVGYALVTSVRDTFPLRYYGLQIHSRPNPSHESVFTAGWAGVALELAIAPSRDPLEDNPRFRGLYRIGALHAGVAVHLIPFTSLSAGGVFLERRTSTVAEERYDPFVALYVGFAVNVNVPALVKGKFATTIATTP